MHRIIKKYLEIEPLNHKYESFSERVRATVRSIPKGKTLSYSEVARKAGKPNAARAVARIMSLNYDPGIPCHRVVCSNGKLGGYNRGGIKVKRKILQAEGIIVKA
jgi:O-6-methylguanine DNA methyltransferase